MIYSTKALNSEQQNAAGGTQGGGDSPDIQYDSQLQTEGINRKSELAEYSSILNAKAQVIYSHTNSKDRQPETPQMGCFNDTDSKN